MPKDFESSNTFTDPVHAVASESGTVLKYFHGPNRRFPVGYVVIDADAPDLPRPLDELRSGGFVA